MYPIVVSDVSPQVLVIPVPSYADISMTMYFYPSQNMWFFNLVWGSFETDGMVMVTTPNLLQQWSEILPFGIGITSKNGTDPSGQECFVASNNFVVQLLVQSDLDAIQKTIYPGN